MRVTMLKQQPQNIANTIIEKAELIADEVFSRLVDAGVFPKECGWNYGKSLTDYSRNTAQVVLYINAVPGPYARTSIPAMLRNSIDIRVRDDGKVTYTIEATFQLILEQIAVIKLPPPRTVTKRKSDKTTITTVTELVSALVDAFEALYADWGGILALLNLLDMHERNGFLYETLLLALVAREGEEIIHKAFEAYLARKLGKHDYTIRHSLLGRHEVQASKTQHFDSPHHAVNIDLRAFKETGEELVATARAKISTTATAEFVGNYSALQIVWNISVNPITVFLPNKDAPEQLGETTTFSVKAVLQRSAQELRTHVVRRCGEIIAHAIARNFAAGSK